MELTHLQFVLDKKSAAEVRAEGETAPLWGRRNFVKTIAKCGWDAVVLLTRAASHGSLWCSLFLLKKYGEECKDSTSC